MRNSFIVTKRSVIMVVAICICAYLLIRIWYGGIWWTHFVASILDKTSLEKAGLLGDSAGAINALFSAFALGGVVFAIYLQVRELKLQREELRATHKQLADQRSEFQTQNETLKRQRFENTFFQMLSLHQEIVNDLDVKTSGKKVHDETISGRRVFLRLFEHSEIPIGADKVSGVRGAIAKGGLMIYETLEYPTWFDHYFRHLYRMVKFVDESKLITTYDEKYDYTSMIRATLSRYELVWLFYNCLSDYGSGKFKPLVEKYTLLKNLRTELLVVESHKNRYAAEAYVRLRNQ